MADKKDIKLENEDEIVDQRLLDLQTEHGFAVGDVSDVYNFEISKNEVEKDKMLGALDKSYQAGVNELNASTDAVVNDLEGKKDELENSYDVESQAAYVDYKKASDPYGVNAEQMASMGMSNTGYSETSRVAMYNQYQNRVAVARAAFTKATADYDKAIADARMQNNVALARLASETYLKQAELSLYYVQKHDTLLAQKTTAIEEVNAKYTTKWQEILEQIEKEKELKIQQDLQDEKERLATLAKNKAAAEASMTPTTAPTNPLTGKTIGGDRLISKADNKETLPDANDPNLEIDVDSIYNLGYGPLTARELEKLIRMGEVVEVVKDGKVTYVRAPLAPGLPSKGK